MEVRVQSKQGATLSGIDPVLAEIHERLHRRPREWLEALKENPGSFLDLEKTVHATFQQMADQVVAGLLAQATQAKDFAQAAKKK